MVSLPSQVPSRSVHYIDRYTTYGVSLWPPVGRPIYIYIYIFTSIPGQRNHIHSQSPCKPRSRVCRCGGNSAFCHLLHRQHTTEATAHREYHLAAERPPAYRPITLPLSHCCSFCPGPEANCVKMDSAIMHLLGPSTPSPSEGVALPLRCWHNYGCFACPGSWSIQAAKNC